MGEELARKFAPAIKEATDIQFTAVTDIRGENKVKKVNEIVQAYVDQEAEKLTIKELAEYVGTKKDGPEKQWAFELMGAKIREGKF